MVAIDKLICPVKLYEHDYECLNILNSNTLVWHCNLCIVMLSEGEMGFVCVPVSILKILRCFQLDKFTWIKVKEENTLPYTEKRKEN